MIYNSKQIKDIFRKKSYSFDTKNWKLNLVGIRLTNKTNLFNDVLYVIYNDNNGVEHIKEYKITTKPGNSYLKTPLASKGTAILVPKQYKDSYSIGLHSGRYEALRQTKAISVYRDNDKNTVINMLPNSIQVGLFGVNIHRSNARSESTYVNKWSAGCQVFSRVNEFNEFMALARKSRKINNNSFTYTLLTKEDFDGYKAGDAVEAPIKNVNTNKTSEPFVPKGVEIPTINDKQRNDKEIINISNAKATTTLKIKQDDDDSLTKGSEVTGSIIPLIKYKTNNTDYTFTYKDILKLNLSYNKRLPEINVVIEDSDAQFTSTLFELTSDDTLVLYLKSTDDTYKNIYQTYNITNVKWDSINGTYVFNGILNLPDLFTSKIQGYENKTSYGVFYDIASELGLGFNSNISATDDRMNWVCGGDTLYNFLNYVCEYAYQNDETFFDWFIDFYNNINFIEVNNQFGTYTQQDTFIKKLFKHEYDGNTDVKVDGKNVLTNLDMFKGTGSYISNLNINNNITERLILNGDTHTLGFYDLDLKEFVTFDVNLSNNQDENSKVIKNKEYKRVYNYGYQDDINNVHNNYTYASINNTLNLKNLLSVKQTIYLDGSNYMYYKYQNIPIGIYTNNSINKDGILLKNGDAVENNDNVGALLIESLSGYMVIYNIAFEWNSTDSNLRQKITVIKR